MEDLSVFQKQNPSAIARRKCIVRYHQDRRTQLVVHFLKGFQQCLRCPGVECAGRFIRKDQLRVMDQGSGTGATLFLSSGYLLGKLIPDLIDL